MIQAVEDGYPTNPGSTYTAKSIRSPGYQAGTSLQTPQGGLLARDFKSSSNFNIASGAAPKLDLGPATLNPYVAGVQTFANIALSWWAIKNQKKENRKARRHQDRIYRTQLAWEKKTFREKMNFEKMTWWKELKLKEEDLRYVRGRETANMFLGLADKNAALRRRASDLRNARITGRGRK